MLQRGKNGIEASYLDKSQERNRKLKWQRKGHTKKRGKKDKK
jgi:hypothetical protein